jgi:retinol dehydrogenase-12
LLDLLKKSAPARIIVIPSEAHKAGHGMDFDDLNNEKNWKNHARPSNSAAFTAYHRAKLSNLYFVYELAERLQGAGVTANAISPGFFINTSIYRNMTGFFLFFAKIIFGFGSLLGLNSPQRSARTYRMLATDPELEQVTATYFEHEKIKNTSAQAKDIELRKKLWS